jgi:Flp pilus assembly pilin Flp
MVAILSSPATQVLQPGARGGRRGGSDLKSHRPPADVSRMKTFSIVLSQLLRDERGGEVLEYALVAGLLVVSAIAVIGSVGTKVLARWKSLDSSL